MTDSLLKTQSVGLHIPALDEVAKVLQNALSKQFGTCSVSVVDCPDLSQPPFLLASKGLCGNPMVADVGGVPFLLPTPVMDKIYDLSSIARQTGLSSVLVLGAGAGPSHVTGCLTEMIANVSFDKNGPTNNQTRMCKVNDETGGYILSRLQDTTECRHLANLYMCEGNPGKVLEIKVHCRTGDRGFIPCVREALRDHYGTQPVALGGAFMLNQGKAKIHVMPTCYADVPLTSDAMLENWLRYFEMSAPLVIVGYMISHDPDLDLRMAHFHCYSDHGDGGHFHYDTTPHDADYTAYFNVAHTMRRVDRPDASQTHNVGRD